MSLRLQQPTRRRRGYTLTEMLIVVVMIGILTMIAVPKFRIYRDRSNVSAMRARVEAMIATTRASAIHKGRVSLFASSGTWMGVWTRNPTSGAWEQQVPWQNVGQAYPNVQVQYGGAAWSYLYYEPRGLTWSSAKPPSTVVFRVVGLTRTDSVCVSRLGQILPRGCTL